MEKYKLRFWFEHGGICIWGANDKAKEKYGYAIEADLLPISDELVSLLVNLEDEYASYLDWEYPPNPSHWSAEHKKGFINRSTEAYNKLCKELGSSYSVENAIAQCVK